jgi:hypothetical protein
MKKVVSLLGCLIALLGSAPIAHAQSAKAIQVGANLPAVTSASQAKADVFVSVASYHARTFPQKRTPAPNLPKAEMGGTEIAAIEQLLASRYAVLQADSTSQLLGMAQERDFSRLRSRLLALNPTWAANSYATEMDFYREQDILRRRRAPVSAGVRR